MYLTIVTVNTYNRKLQCPIIVHIIVTMVTERAIEGTKAVMDLVQAGDIVKSLDIQDMVVKGGMVIAVTMAEETNEETICTESKKYSTDYVNYFTD